MVPRPSFLKTRTDARAAHLQARSGQSRVAMDAVTVRFDVSKDRLDVADYPSQEAFCVARNTAGLEFITARLKALGPLIFALEAARGS